MEYLKPLDKKEINRRLWEIELSLVGLAALFQGGRDIPFKDDELCGIGEIIRGIAEKAASLRLQYKKEKQKS